MNVERIVSIISIIIGVWMWGDANALDIRDFGAIGDGNHIDSPAINAAIEQAASQGETVVVPAGVWLCYSVHLKSGVTLRLEKGAVLKAAVVTEDEGYDEAEPNRSHYQDFGHSHWHNSLLWGERLHDVTIEGEGLIDGTGVLSRGEPRRGYTGKPQANKALALRDCQRVTIRGVSFLNCGHFALLLTGVDDLLIENVLTDTNRDGFDIDCCERVVIRNCRVNTPNDDAIVLKCSYALGWPKPTTDVLIENCEVSGYDAGSMLSGEKTQNTLKAPDGDGPTGRIKLGTESNGGFRRITIRNCTFTHCRGLALETVDGAKMEDVDVSNLMMTDICNSPIYIRLGDRMRAPEGFPPSSVENIRLRNIKVVDADSRYACLIAGEEGHPVKNVRIENLEVEFRGGLTLEDVSEQRGSNPFFFKGEQKSANSDQSQNRKRGSSMFRYPEPSAHGIQPAWGFSISHAENIRLKNVRLSTKQYDERPCFYLENTKRVKRNKLQITNHK
ncbi:MAG: right-handed parallel beta-helix repeat-containing protein [Prevotella sp.]|nr:right-handed parallel beta-helix repeat-containing protein [Prevotella sp.]